MGLQHLLRKERQVKLGSKWYTVGPVSLVHFLQLYGHMGAYFSGDTAADALAKMPLEVLGAFSPLIVTEPLSKADLDKQTPEQVAALWQAFSEVNDLDYLGKQYVGDENAEPSDWDIVDAMDFLCEQRPAYKLDDVLRMPAQVFFVQLECIKKKIEDRNAAADPNRGKRELTPADLMRLAEGEPLDG